MNIVSLFQARSKYFYIFLVALSLVSSFTSIGLLMIINIALGSKAVVFMGEYSYLYFIVLVALSYIIGIAFQVYMVKLTNDIMFNLELSLIQKVRNASYESFSKMGTEKIYAALNDIRVLARFPEIFVVLLNSTVTIVCSMGYLFWVSPLACITVLGLMTVLMIFYLYQNKKIEKGLNKIRDLQDGYYDSLRELLAGFRQIRISNVRSSNIYHKFLLANRSKSKDLSVNTANKVIVNEMTGSHSWYLVLGVVIFVLPLLFNVQVTEIAAFITTVLFLIGPVSQILNAIPFYTSFKIAVERIDKITNLLQTDAVSSEQLYQPSGFKSLRFENIVYCYNREDDTSFELRLSDLHIENNEIVFFVGGNGSGKTTFINLLTGLCRPQQGNIYLDGKLISWEEYCAFRNSMAVVYTNHHLFRENYDNHQYNENPVFNKFLNLLNLHGIARIDEHSSRIDTNLSKGQQKRISLLMALLENKPILILDEWAAEQDPANRALFYQEWLEHIRAMGKTIIAVSHDDDFYYEADRVVKFDFGRIVSDTKKKQSVVAG